MPHSCLAFCPQSLGGCLEHVQDWSPSHCSPYWVVTHSQAPSERCPPLASRSHSTSQYSAHHIPGSHLVSLMGPSIWRGRHFRPIKFPSGRPANQYLTLTNPLTMISMLSSLFFQILWTSQSERHEAYSVVVARCQSLREDRDQHCTTRFFNGWFGAAFGMGSIGRLNWGSLSQK